MHKIKCIFVSVLVIFLLSSCDSLWNVGEGVNVAFNLNLPSFEQNNNVFSAGRAVSPEVDGAGDVGSDLDLSVTVSLHRSSDDFVIDSKTLSYEQALSSDVTFYDVPRNLTVYAKITIINKSVPDLSVQSNVFFGAITDDARISGDKTLLVAKPNVAFVNPSYNPSGGDELVGIIPNYSVQTLEEAVEILEDGDTFPKQSVIYVMDTITLENGDNVVLDYPGVTLKRYKNENNLITVETGAHLTLKNITIDGNKQSGLVANGSLVSASGTLNMEEGAVLQNNINDGTNFTGGGALSINADFFMNGGKIQYNEDRNQIYMGGGIYSSSGKLHLAGGIISHNKAISGGGIFANSDVELNGTIIKYNTAIDSGGGIYLSGGFFLTILNGRISHNTATVKGGGVDINGTILMSGGAIEENQTSGNGGGIFLDTSPSVLFVSGNPIIRGNKSINAENNVYYDYTESLGAQRAEIVIKDSLLQGAYIGIVVNEYAFDAISPTPEDEKQNDPDATIATGQYTPPPGSNGLSDVNYTITGDDLKQFYSDNPEYSFSLDSEPTASDVIIIAEKNIP